jgi:dihydrofolate synthase / folylpolyglutamate synthase
MIKTYNDAIDYIFSKLPMFSRIGPVALKYNLDNILNLCSELGNPQKKLKMIHVAGTNGKGTCSHIISSIFQESGYKTGLYTSPHYKDFRERIKVNGLLITKKYLRDFIIKNTELIEKYQPSYFELSVALAFSYFESQKVDIAIIEVGLGGRLDSTNIINPFLSVITNISFDHVSVLGDTIEKIAFEKAGIIKKNIPIVIGVRNDKTSGIFMTKAVEQNAPIYFSQDLVKTHLIKENIFSSKIETTIADQKYLIKSSLNGPFAEENLRTALAAIKIFKKYNNSDFHISDHHIIRGINKLKSNTKYFGRWRVLGHNPLIIADGAHNEDAIEKTLQYIEQSQYNNLHIIIGIVDDKSWEKVFSFLPHSAKYYFSEANIPRAMKADKLKSFAKSFNLAGEVYLNVQTALDAAKGNADKKDIILIFGSIYLVAEL